MYYGKTSIMKFEEFFKMSYKDEIDRLSTIFLMKSP